MMCQNMAFGMANSEDPDQTAQEQSDQDLHSLPGLFRPNIWALYGNLHFWKLVKKAIREAHPGDFSNFSQSPILITYAMFFLKLI